MRKSPFFRTALACGCVVVLDFIFRQFALYAMVRPTVASTDFFAFEVLANTAAKASESLPNAGLAIFTLVVASVFVSAALASHIFLPARLKAWPIGLGITAGGLFANAVDRAVHGAAIDVFTINPAQMNMVFDPIHFNLGNVCEIIGALFLAYGLIRAANGDWAEQRKLLLLERGYQFRFCWYLQGAMTIGFVPMFFAGLVIFQTGTTSSDLVVLFVATAFFAYVALSVVAWSMGILISHRVAGPILKFSKVAVRRLNGSRPAKHDKAFSFRENDEFQKRLENVMHEIDRYTEVIDNLTKKKIAVVPNKKASW